MHSMEGGHQGTGKEQELKKAPAGAFFKIL